MSSKCSFTEYCQKVQCLLNNMPYNSGMELKYCCEFFSNPNIQIRPSFVLVTHTCMSKVALSV